MESLFDLLNKKDLTAFEKEILRDRLNVIEQQPARNLQVTGSGALELWGDLRVDGDSVIDGTLSGGGTLATGGYTGTFPNSGTLIMGSGAANRLAVFTDEYNLAQSYALTTVGDLMYMANTGTSVQEIYFENTLVSTNYGRAEYVLATITLDRAPEVGETANIIIDYYAGNGNNDYVSYLRLRKSSITGTIVSEVSLTNQPDPDSYHWTADINDATPTQTYVVTFEGTFNLGNPYESNYRYIEINLIGVDPIPARLAIGSEDQFLRVASGVPTWETVTVITGVSDTASVDLTVTGSTLSAAVLPAGVDHNSLANYAANQHYLQTDITNVSTGLATGLLTVTNGTGALGSTPNNSSNWDTAYSWGNHASAGYVPNTRTISTSGTGLSGGGDLSANRTITLTSSSNPGAAASVLASDASGYLQLVRLGLGTTPTAALTFASGTTAAGGIAFGDVALYRSAANRLRLDDAYYINYNGTTALVIENSGTKDNTFVVNTTNGWVGINKTTELGWRSAFQVYDLSYGAISVGNNTADGNTLGRFIVPSYLKTNLPIQAFGMAALNGSSTAQFGGGTTTFNSATHLKFYTDSNPNQTAIPTTAGTLHMQIDSAGLITMYDGGLVVNENGAAAGDMRAESDTESNMLFLDASADQMFFGGSTNGIRIDKGGELTLIGTATVWDDLRVEPTIRGVAGAKTPSFDNIFGGLYLYSFDDAAAGSEKEIFFNVQLPHTWKEGSSIYPHVHWMNEAAGTAGHVVRWGLEYSVATIGGTFSSSPTTIYGTTIVGGGDITVQYEHLITSLSSISMTSNLISTILVCRLFRSSSNAADTYTGTAGLLSVDFHVEIDGMGSAAEYTA